MLMYFWLNYCDENHVERIAIAVKNINHLFHLTSEIIETDSLHLFFHMTLNKRNIFSSLILTLHFMNLGAIDKSMVL